MLNKKSIILALTLILCMIFTCNATENQKQKWCWTESMVNEVGFILDSAKGGFNWGYCMIAEQSKEVKKIYSAKVVTALTPESTTESEVLLKMCGARKCNKNWITLSSVGYNKQGVEQLANDFEAEDVGSLNSIKLKIVGNSPWRCRKVIISYEGTEYNFDCLKKLYPITGQDQIESFADGSTDYTISIKTDDKKECENFGPVHIQLYGNKKTAPEKVFTDEKMQSGQIITSIIKTEDIGDIKGFKLILNGNGKWCPVSVKIISGKTSEDKTYTIKEEILTFPGKNSYEMKDKIEPISENPNDNNDDKEDDDTSITIIPSDNNNPSPSPSKVQTKEQSLNIHNADGGLIEFKEKSSILDLTCDQQLINTDNINFGPSYPTQKIDYNTFLARCPYDCNKSAIVYGIGVHPDSSPICYSAIVDNATSLYGGIISISVYSGLDKYEVPNDINSFGEIKIESFESAKKSYSVAKVDNIDLVEKDFRIVNSFGKISNEGRPEVRIEGEWGTICNIGNDKRSAKLFCRDLGFKDGEWIGQPNEKVCKDNECGNKSSKIHFSNLNSTLNDIRFLTINKSFADATKCDHSLDSLIKCFNENYQNEVSIPEKTLRLESSKQDANQVTGRLEMYINGKFLPICKNKFNYEAVKIACKTLGFTNGELFNDESAKDFRLDSNSVGFAATNIVCDDKKSRLDACLGEYKNINCDHKSEDLVITCFGEGDITGKSQYFVKITNNPPQLGKLSLPGIEAKCTTTGSHKDLRGDPGSLIKITCPSGCEKLGYSLVGTGNYHNDSNICIAAIHMGVLRKGLKGSFIFQRTHSNNSFIGININEIESKSLTINNNIKNPSFTLTKTNSGWENMNKLFNNKSSSFLENEISVIENYPKLATSFLGLEMQEITDPIFNFLESDKNHIFSVNDNYVYEEGNFNSDKFSLLFRFNMNSFEGVAQTIFSFKGPDGFNIYINRDDELMIGKMTENKYLKSLEVICPINTWITGFVTYKEGKLSYSIHISKGNDIFLKDTPALLEIPKSGRLGIGRQADSNIKQFNGQIEFVEIFNQVLDFSLVSQLIKKARTRKSNNTPSREYTVDARKCVSSCMLTSPGTGTPPPEAEMDKPLSVDIDNKVPNGNTDKNLNTAGVIEINGNKELPLSPEEEKKTENPGGIISPKDNISVPLLNNLENKINAKQQTKFDDGIILEEDTTLEDKRFIKYKVPGVFVIVRCPKSDPKSNYSVFGTAIYRENSSICKAALHLGVLKPMIANNIIVKIGSRKKAYNGSTGKNDIITQDIIETQNMLSFSLESAPDISKKVTCDTTLASIREETNNSKILFIVCPESCQNSNTEIFGGNESEDVCEETTDLSAGNCIYSVDSSICKAAIHCGVMNSFGGYIKVEVLGEHPRFIKSLSFGIQSKEKEAQVESFKFIGEKSAIFTNFVESYTGSIFDNWFSSVSKLETDNVNSNTWIFENNDNFTQSTEKGEKIRSIRHQGIISCRLPNTPGSLLTKRNVDFSNGEFKFNIISSSAGQIFAFFRYIDESNHIGIVIDPSKGIGEFKLFSKVNGSVKILDSKSHNFSLNKWHRYTVKLHSDRIQVFVQDDNIRLNRKLFDVEFYLISRGTIGFGSSGNDNFYITGIQVKPFEQEKVSPSETLRRFTWDHVISHARNAVHQMEIFCKDLNKKSHLSQQMLSLCHTPRGFCNYQCGSYLGKGYEILKFQCLSECIKEVKASLNPEITETLKETKLKEGDLCDFMESDEKIFPAKVDSISNTNGEILISISYEDGINGTKRASNLPYNVSVFKCGSKLKNRTDCLLKN